MTKPRYSQQDVEILATERVYDGFYKMDRLSLKHKTFAGEWSQPITRELMHRHDAVCVLIWDPDADTIVICEQFRVGSLGEPSPWLYELVAGLIDKDESPEEVGRREAVEEAGVDIDQMKFLYRYQPSPGGSNETVYLYIAQANLPKSGGVFGLAEENEDIRTHIVERSEAMKWIADGRIANAASLLALQWLSYHEGELRQEWGVA